MKNQTVFLVYCIHVAVVSKIHILYESTKSCLLVCLPVWPAAKLSLNSNPTPCYRFPSLFQSPLNCRKNTNTQLFFILLFSDKVLEDGRWNNDIT